MKIRGISHPTPRTSQIEQNDRVAIRAERRGFTNGPERSSRNSLCVAMPITNAGTWNMEHGIVLNERGEPIRGQNGDIGPAKRPSKLADRWRRHTKHPASEDDQKDLASVFVLRQS